MKLNDLYICIAYIHKNKNDIITTHISNCITYNVFYTKPTYILKKVIDNPLEDTLKFLMVDIKQEGIDSIQDLMSKTVKTQDIKSIIDHYIIQKAYNTKYNVDDLRNIIYQDTLITTITPDKFSWDLLDDIGEFTLYPNDLFKQLPSLSKGQFVLVTARTNVGKTTFVLNNLNWFVENKHKCLFINTERHIKTIYKTLLNIKYKNPPGKLSNEHKKDFISYTDKFDIIFTNTTNILNKDVLNNYDVVFIDLLDLLIQDRSTKNLNTLYQTILNLAVTTDTLFICTSQLSAEACSETFPNESMLENSKTGKASACDLIVTLSTGGISHLKTKDKQVVAIGTPKNKLSNDVINDYILLNNKQQIVYDKKVKRSIDGQ